MALQKRPAVNHWASKSMKEMRLAPRRGHISNSGDTIEHSRTISKLSHGGLNGLRDRAFASASQGRFVTAWVGGHPSWTRLELVSRTLHGASSLRPFVPLRIIQPLREGGGIQAVGHQLNSVTDRRPLWARQGFVARPEALWLTAEQAGWLVV